MTVGNVGNVGNICSECGKNHDKEDQEEVNKALRVAKDALERVHANSSIMDNIVGQLSRLATPADRVAMVAALSHFVITSESGENAFDEVLDGFLLVLKPDAATRVMMTAHHAKA